MKNYYDCIVIGGGASGLFFSATFDVEKAQQTKGSGFRGLILEKTSRPGTKLLMSGGGHCNITHAGSIKDFIPAYGDKGKLIRKVLYTHSNLELMDFLAQRGLPLVADEEGRVFPKSKKAKDVLDFLLDRAEENGFEIVTGAEVFSIKASGAASGAAGAVAGAEAEAGHNWEVACKNSKTKYMAKNIVIATGGASYPKTGSDGSFFGILKRDLGLEISELKPGLCPIKIQGYPYEGLAGISVSGHLKKIGGDKIGADKSGGDKIGGDKAATKKATKVTSSGAILFTHEGFSGPAAINISGDLNAGDKVQVNYIYPTKYEEAFDVIQRASDGSKAGLATILAENFDVAKKLARGIADRSNNSTKKAARLLTEDEFTVRDCGSFDSAMVTRGGVKLEQVDLATMELKSHPGVFVTGEALDVDGITGGYNLQFAYSSARVAGDAIAKGR